MRSKKIVILLSIAFLLLSAFSPVAMAEETRRVLSFTEEGLRVRVYAPYQAYPGDRITMRVTVTALEDLDDVTIDIYIFGSKSDAEGRVGYDSWDDAIGVLYNERMDDGDTQTKDYRVRIPSDSDPGLVYGLIDCTWLVYRPAGWEDRSYKDSFTITYLRNKDYEDLQVDYSDLLNKYNKLVADYNKLSSEHNSLLATYNSLKKDYDSARAAYDSLNSRYESLESEHETLVSDYSALQKKYTSLDSDYKSLLAEYDALESEYETSVGELGTSRNLMYVFVVTTMVFIVTSIILFARKPKTA